MVKMKYSELVESYQSINEELLRRTDLANKPALYLRRVGRVLKSEVQDYEDQRKVIFNRYAEDTNGQMRITPSNIGFYQEDLTDLINETVVLDLPEDRKITLKDLGNKTPSPHCMIVLDWLLDILDEEEESAEDNSESA